MALFRKCTSFQLDVKPGMFKHSAWTTIMSCLSFLNRWWETKAGISLLSPYHWLVRLEDVGPEKFGMMSVSWGPSCTASVSHLVMYVSMSEKIYNESTFCRFSDKITFWWLLINFVNRCKITLSYDVVFLHTFTQTI